MEVKELVKEYNEWVDWLSSNGIEDGFSEIKIRNAEEKTKEQVLDEIKGNLEMCAFWKKFITAFENMVQVMIKESEEGEEKEDETKD